MNCNLCPYRKLCPLPRTQGFEYEGGQPFGYTSPVNLGNCPLFRALTKETE